MLVHIYVHSLPMIHIKILNVKKNVNLVFSHFINIDQQQIHIRLRQLSFESYFRSVSVFEFVRKKYHEMIMKYHEMKWFTLLFLVNAVFCADHNPDGK